MKISLSAGFAVGVFAVTFASALPAWSQPLPAELVPGRLKVKYYGRFIELPVGSVRPRGWIQGWLKRQADGLTGHPENLGYPYDTCLYAGLIPPPLHRNPWWQDWWPYEQSAYFVDATTRLSLLIDDPSVSRRRGENLDYILAHSSGTNLGGSVRCWPNAVVGRALMAQFSANGDPRIAATLQNWLLTSANAIAQGGRNGANFEEAFFLYGLTGDPRLLSLCRKVYDGYLHDTNSFFTVEKIQSKTRFREHGVTAAEELKCLPLMYCYSGDPAALRLAGQAYEKVLDSSLMPDGGLVSSEHLAPAEFHSVHESCDITDWSWSLGYLFMATGETRFADLVERATFNALPGAVTKDFRQFQYFSAVNQTVIAATNRHTPRWPTRMTYRAAHDTECCAGNINRAMPNYVVRMWMWANDGGLAAVYYGPSEITTRVKGQTVTITEDTDYPFGDEIHFRLTTPAPIDFSLHFRIPGWCDTAAVRVNRERPKPLGKPGQFASLKREFHDGDVIHLRLPMPVRFESWFSNQSVCVSRGPLVFSLRPTEERLEHTNDPPEIGKFMEGHGIRGFPEVEFLPRSEWRYGLDKALKGNSQTIRVVRSPVPDNPFLADQTPVHLELPLRPLPGWSPDIGDVTHDEPLGLPPPAILASAAPATNMILVPYGATHLRLTTFPLVSPPGVKN